MQLFWLFCFAGFVSTICDASFSMGRRPKITADEITITVTLYSSYPKCMMKLLKHNDKESNTIVNEQTPKLGSRRRKQCIFKFTNLTPNSVYVAHLRMAMKVYWSSKPVWSRPKVYTYRTERQRIVKPVPPVKPVLPEVAKPAVNQKETATVTVLKRAASPFARSYGHYEIRAETTSKLVKLTVVPINLGRSVSNNMFACEILLKETKNRKGRRTSKRALYKKNKCVFSVRTLPKGKEISTWVRMRARPSTRRLSYSVRKWLRWGMKYSGLKTKEAVVRVATQKTKPKDFSGGFALEQEPYGDYVQVIVTLPPNSKDEHCDMHVQTLLGIQTKLVERGQCKFQVRSKFPKNVRIRVQVRHFISVKKKFHQVKSGWKSMELIFLKPLKSKPGSSKQKDLYQVFADDLEEKVKLVVRPNRDLSIHKSLSHCEIELRSRGLRPLKLKQPFVNKKCKYSINGLKKGTAYDIRVRMLGGTRNRAHRSWYLWSSQYTGLKTTRGMYSGVWKICNYFPKWR